jgi:hypothetical protein
MRIPLVTISRSTEVLRPKNAVSVGLLTLAKYESPEANLLVESKSYALQRHTHFKNALTGH